MLDSKISEAIYKEVSKDCIVVFDEAHNIDNICLEAFSVDINSRLLSNASKNLDFLSASLNTMQQENSSRLEAEYQQLIAGL